MIKENYQEIIQSFSEEGDYKVIEDGREIFFQRKSEAFEYFQYEAQTASWSELGIYIDGKYQDILQQEFGYQYEDPNLFRR